MVAKSAVISLLALLGGIWVVLCCKIPPLLYFWINDPFIT